MPSIDRDNSASRESERRLRHQHSTSSDHGRAIVPMWDSSDPDRAPPPLPLNPASPSLASRPNTSTAIQSAHAALAEKARENTHALIPNPSPKRHESPERLLIKGAAHKRMQSLQTGNVRDLSNYIESGSLATSPTKSPEKITNRPSSPFTSKELTEIKSVEKNMGHLSNPVPTPVPPGRDTPTIRPSLRRPPQSILGENTPPQSATMLALQSMSARDAENPLSNVTNGSTALIRTPQTIDAISSQILSLTSIATSLQREMAQLSRRSKDNATDLISLKEATNARDEDIRKSLRDLVASLSESSSRSSNALGNGGYMLDNKPHTPSSRAVKSFALPRIPSPTSFSTSLDRESTVSPRPYNIEGAASIALLEKILREMSTQEGQEMLVSRLAEVADRVAKEGAATAKKLEELLQFIKNNNGPLVPRAGGGNGNGIGRTRSRNFSFSEVPKLELDFGNPQSGSMVTRVDNLLSDAGNKENRGDSNPSRAADVINEDILKIIRNVKDSVSQGGGLTAEVKALVRELRGEVLGMGREIGRKLDHVDANSPSIKDATAERERIARVVQDGLQDLKEHMDRVMREARRQSSSSSISRATVDAQEVYNAVKNALTSLQSTLHPTSQEPSVSKEDIIEAVREAWESYKPEIEVQHFGLERDELLACLKEGIQEYTSHQNARAPAGATREEILTAVVEGLKHFSPPRVETEASLSREEILDAVRECLEEFEFPSAPPEAPRDVEITKGHMIDAVREGLSTFDFPYTTALSREVGDNITRDDVFDAVRASLESHSAPLDGYNQQVLTRLQDIMETMREEFKAVSDEAKQNVAAHGRDTEQVLDATKDGLENLRADIESYINRAADISGRDEILDSMRENFESLRAEVEALISRGSESSLDGLKAEFENLRETMSMSMVPGGTSADSDIIIRALKEGLESLRVDIERPRDSSESILSGTGEILDALHDGFAGLRAEVEKIGSKPVDMTVNYEILDTLRDGLESVRADIDRLHESDHGERELAAITDGAVITTEGLKRNDIENLEVLITQLRIKVEALESMPPPPPPPPQAAPDALSRDDLADVEETLKNVQTSVDEISARERPTDEDAVRKEDVEAIETLLRNTKAKIDDMDLEQTAKKEQLDAVDEIVRETRDTVNELASRLSETLKREDVSAIEALVKDIIFGVEELKERVANNNDDAEKATKTDVEAVEAVCLDIKTQIEQMVMTDLVTLASKDDVKNLEELVKEFKGRAELHAELDARAFEERQAEIVGVGERVSEVKIFLEDFKDAIKEKLDEGSTSIEALGKFLEDLGDTINQNANVADTVKEIFETMRTEFEKCNAGVVGAKLETDENFQKTWDKFDKKVDEKFSEILIKYEDVQSLVKANAQTSEEKNAETESAMMATKVVIEELKLLVDTFGITLSDSVEKADEASKTVFNRVEDTFSRVDDTFSRVDDTFSRVDDTFSLVEATHADAKAEHQLTREQAQKSLVVVEGVQEHVTEYHPKILDSIKDVLAIVGQHYEHSRVSVDSIQEKIAEKASLAQILDQPLLREAPVEKYDDTYVHQKLDRLVEHMNADGKSFTQLQILDQIHQRVMRTAAEVSEFVSTQKQRIANDHEDKEKAVEAATIALEKQLTHKDLVQAEVTSLQEEKDHLIESVSVLKAEKEDLAHQKMRLVVDVTSFETALRIRREELHAMEARAERLERRIIDGVIDHSRALLITRSHKGTDAMSLKRVPSHATSITGSVMTAGTSKSRSSHTQNAVNMAMDGNRAVTNQSATNPSSTSRRILSLSQITHNVPSGGFKRSHSVKTPGGSGSLRKSSWGGSLTRKGYGDLNKENLALKESEEDSGNISDAGTMRRTSIGDASGFGTGTEMTESIEEGTEYSDEGLETPIEEHGHMVLYEESGQEA